MKSFICLLTFLLLLGCSCLKKAQKTKEEDSNIEISDLLNSNKQIDNFIDYRDKETLMNLKEIVLFKIVPHQIDGTEEFSNKAEIIKTLSQKEQNAFLSIFLNDSLYNWDSINVSKNNFTPQYQYRIRDTTRGFSVLYSPLSNEIGIISLNSGQQTIKVNPKMEVLFASIIREKLVE
jgi:hypothetical protein